MLGILPPKSTSLPLLPQIMDFCDRTKMQALHNYLMLTSFPLYTEGYLSCLVTTKWQFNKNKKIMNRGLT